MAQFFGIEKLQDLSKSGGLNMLLPPSTFRLGGLGFQTLANLNLDLSTSGLGGIDAGVVGADSLYNVFLVNNSGAAGIIASLATNPLGYSNYRLIGTSIVDGGGTFVDAFSNETDGVVNGVIGDIKALGMDPIPDGFIYCDGRSLSRTSFQRLFNAIGTSWGADNAGVFRVPDLRGYIPRGKDAGSGIDPDSAGRIAKFTGGATGNNIGSYQGEATKQNGLNVANGGGSKAVSSSGGSKASGGHSADHIHSGTSALNNVGHTHGGSTSSNGDHYHKMFSDVTAFGVGINQFPEQTVWWQGQTNFTYSLQTASGSNTVPTLGRSNTTGNHTHSISTSGVSSNHSHTFNTGGVNSNHTHTTDINHTHPNIDINHVHTMGSDNETRMKNAYVQYAIRY